MKRTLAALAALPLLVSLTACGGDDKPTATETVTVSASPTATVDAPEVDASATAPNVAPNVGDTALAVGQWREGSDVRTRVIKVNQPGHGGMPDYLSGDDSATGATVLVRSCVRKEAAKAGVFSTYGWSVEDARGAAYEQASSSWEVWPPLPQFPVTERTIRPGKCVEGWILLPTPADTLVTTVVMGDGEGSAIAEWNVR